jgi:hypothetical protein
MLRPYSQEPKNVQLAPTKGQEASQPGASQRPGCAGAPKGTYYWGKALGKSKQSWYLTA